MWRYKGSMNEHSFKTGALLEAHMDSVKTFWDSGYRTLSAIGFVCTPLLLHTYKNMVRKEDPVEHRMLQDYKKD